jgi:N6-L-threonylcarbamoyladenine synthase
MMNNLSRILWLGIETSCDDTACAVLEEHESSIEILSNCLYSQIDEHKAWGGIVPELASRAHLEKIIPVLKQALEEAKISIEEIRQIAFTARPGLMGSLLVGASFAKGLAKDLGVECYGINHLEGHIFSALSHFPPPPSFIALIVSGGHTELVLAKSNFDYVSIGCTRDDAAGEAFDKSGKILGLGYPAGVEISELAKKGNPHFYEFPRALNDNSFEFSFSGLKTAVNRYVQTQGEEFVKEHIADICASLQEAIADILSLKAVNAAKKNCVESIVLCGGVSANYRLRELLAQRCEKENINLIYPPQSLCTDNGAMIAAAAIFRKRAGMLKQDNEVRAHCPLLF